MKRIISLMFLLFSITLFSQSEKVNFENKLTYKYNTFSPVLYVSKKHPKLSLKDYPSTSISNNWLYYKGTHCSYGINDNNEISVNNYHYFPNIIKNVTKGEKKEIINGFKCEKYIVETENFLDYEVFIIPKHKINNIDYLSNLFIFEKTKYASIFKSGLVVKVQNVNLKTGEYHNIQELVSIEKTNLSVFIDLKDLDLRINRYIDGYTPIPAISTGSPDDVIDSLEVEVIKD